MPSFSFNETRCPGYPLHFLDVCSTNLQGAYKYSVLAFMDKNIDPRLTPKVRDISSNKGSRCWGRGLIPFLPIPIKQPFMHIPQAHHPIVTCTYHLFPMFSRAAGGARRGRLNMGY